MSWIIGPDLFCILGSVKTDPCPCVNVCNINYGLKFKQTVSIYRY